MKSRRASTTRPRPGDHTPDIHETAIEPMDTVSPGNQSQDDAPSQGPRGVIEQAARDIRRGLVDTDLHGTPSNVPGPGRDPERTEGAVVPPEGVDRTTFGRHQRRNRKTEG